MPEDELLTVALDMAKKVASYSQPIVSMAKECVNQAYESTLHEGTPHTNHNWFRSYARSHLHDLCAPRRCALRASRVPQHVRDQRPEGGHEGLHREGPARLDPLVIAQRCSPDLNAQKAVKAKTNRPRAAAKYVHVDV